MQYILNLLPLLACPLMMGGAMWFLMRSGREQEPERPRNTPQRNVLTAGKVISGPAPDLPMLQSGSSPSPSPLKAIWDCVQMCLNWKVLLGLVVVAAAIWFVAPQFALVAIPVLLLLVCPASMIFMMARMGRSGPSTDAPGCAACGIIPTREQQLASLKNQHEALSAQISELEQTEAGSSMTPIQAAHRRER